MAVRLTEKKFLRIFLKGIPVFLFVLAIGLFPYVYTLKHEFEAASGIKYETQVEISIGTYGADKPAFTFSELETFVREKIPGSPIIRMPRPNKEPNLMELIVDISKEELTSILDLFFERELRLKNLVEKRIVSETEIRMNLLEAAIEQINEQLERPAIDNNVGTEPVVAMPWLLEDLIELDQQQNVIEPSDVNLVSEDVSGGSVWTIWRTISAIIGSLGVIYFAAISGLAFGYILDRRA